MENKKIAIIENTGKDFFISRIRLANFLKRKGCLVTAIVPNDGFAKKIKENGFEVIVVGKNIRGKGILNKLKFATDFYQIIKVKDFDIVHCFRMQPNIIGGFIGGILRLNVYNHITGLGILFSKNTFKYIVQKNIVKLFYQLNNKIFKTKYIFQNKEDLIDLGIKENFKIIKGSSVNEEHFFQKNLEKRIFLKKLNLDEKKMTILFVSRLLKLKGLDVLVKALELANKSFDNKFQLLVVGWIDEQNEDSHTQEDIEHFNKISFIHFLGERKDVSDLINISDVCALPTRYREGTPRFLLEAMACAKPIITTNMPGCNHLIDNENQNGFLIERNDPFELSEVLFSLSQSDLITFGNNSRKLYFQKFSEEIVYNSIFDFYNQ